MKFHEVALVYDALRRATGRLEITHLLAQLLQKASAEEASYIAYLSLGEVYPAYRGVVFSIAEKSSFKIAAQLLGTSVEHIQKMVHKTGDMGDVIAQGTWDGQKELTVLQVYHALCDITTISGVGSQEQRFARVHTLLRQLDPLSAALVLRILIGKLRLGFSDITLIDALSWMLTGSKSARKVIEHAYNISADIGLMAYVARSGGVAALENIQSKPGIPIRPAAAERLMNAQEIVDKLGACVAQPKLDGFRVQVHVWYDNGVQQVRFFSRNLQPMDGMPELEKAAGTCVTTSLIVEGEAISYDEDTGSYHHFQQTVKRRRKHAVAETAQQYPLRLVLFDVLYYDGASLLDMPHAQRYALLQELFKHCSDISLIVIDEVQITTGVQLERYFTRLVAEGLEGIIAKRNDAVYQAGKRNFNWVKLKRQTVGALADTIDAVVLGYYHGRGKRSHFGIGAFLVGVYDKAQDSFVTIARIGTGLRDEEWKQLKKMCDEVALLQKPINVVCDENLFPDVWVDPTIVIEVAADEITRSPLHTAALDKEGYGLSLRFPRMLSFREDKSALDATTVPELISMAKEQYVRKD